MWYRGEHLRTSETATATACCDACSLTARCVSFNFEPPEQWTHASVGNCALASRTRREKGDAFVAGQLLDLVAAADAVAAATAAAVASVAAAAARRRRRRRARRHRSHRRRPRRRPTTALSSGTWKDGVFHSAAPMLLAATCDTLAAHQGRGEARRARAPLLALLRAGGRRSARRQLGARAEASRRGGPAATFCGHDPSARAATRPPVSGTTYSISCARSAPAALDRRRRSFFARTTAPTDAPAALTAPSVAKHEGCDGLLRACRCCVRAASRRRPGHWSGRRAALGVGPSCSRARPAASSTSAE